LAILIQKKNRGTSLAKAEEPAAEVQQPAPEKSLSEEIKETSPVVANEAEKVAEPEKAVEEKKEEQPLKEEQPAKQESSKKEDKKPQP